MIYFITWLGSHTVDIYVCSIKLLKWNGVQKDDSIIFIIKALIKNKKKTQKTK